MKKGKETQFCMKCGKEMPYDLQKIEITRRIREKDYLLKAFSAFCAGCGEAVSPPGLSDSNAAWIDRQYREKEGIVEAKTIRELMAVYRIGPIALSLALGLDEAAVSRYLAGQIPSPEASEAAGKAMESPAFMIKRLRENRERIGEAAYGKAVRAGKEYRHFLALSEKMRTVIGCLLKKTGQITPLSLQKMLYFTQGLHMALYGRELFPEDCQAWAHGPVYKEVYELFRDFQYKPIDSGGFFSFYTSWGKSGELPVSGKKVIDLAAEAFGIYDGKQLEKVTHGEAPWKEARDGRPDGRRSRAVITKESVRNHFAAEALRYDFTSADGIRKYIDSRLYHGFNKTASIK